MLKKLFQYRNHRGNTVLEAALVLPILLSLAFGTAEYGYFFFMKHSLEGAAREGCRAGIVLNATNTNVTQAIASSLFASGLNSSKTLVDSKYTVKITDTSGSNVTVNTVTAGNPIQVEVNSTWGAVGLHAMGPMGIVSTKIVKGVTVMRKES